MRKPLDPVAHVREQLQNLQRREAPARPRPIAIALELFECTPATEQHLLVRLAVRVFPRSKAPTAAMSLLVYTAEGEYRVAPLPDPGGGERERGGEPPLRLGFAVPMKLLGQRMVALALDLGDGRVAVLPDAELF